VQAQHQLAPALVEACRYGGEALVERYVKGREVTVGIVAGEVLGSLEVAHGGSSVGVSLVQAAHQLAPALMEACRYGGEALVERYVKGKEVTVGILGGQVLGSLEVVHTGGTFDFDTKYKSGTAKYHLPPRLSPTRVQNVEAMALKAYEALHCRGYARVDFMCSESGAANDVLLEVNTLPGMTATSLLPKIAAHAGISFPELCDRIVKLAALDDVEVKASVAVAA